MFSQHMRSLYGPNNICIDEVNHCIKLFISVFIITKHVFSIPIIKICESVLQKNQKIIVVKIFKKRFVKVLLFSEICKTCFRNKWKVCMVQTIFVLIRLTFLWQLFISVFIKKHKIIERCIWYSNHSKLY